MRVAGIKIKCQDMVYISTHVVHSIEANGKIINSMGRVSMNLQMEQFMKESG